MSTKSLSRDEAFEKWHYEQFSYDSSSIGDESVNESDADFLTQRKRAWDACWLELDALREQAEPQDDSTCNAEPKHPRWAIYYVDSGMVGPYAKAMGLAKYVEYKVRSCALCEVDALTAEVKRLKEAGFATEETIQQTLGKALGYPWFKDYPKDFPNATEADGVCVGDHVAASLAAEASTRIRELQARVEAAEAQVRELREALKQVCINLEKICSDEDLTTEKLAEHAESTLPVTHDLAATALHSTPAPATRAKLEEQDWEKFGGEK